MIVIDIGNTDIVIGIYTKHKLDKTLRFNTKSKNTIRLIKSRFTNRYIHQLNIKYKICILSSVVPEINNKIKNLFKFLKFKVLNITTNNIPFDIQFNYQPKELGSDRIANTFAAIKKYGNNCLIIDFGTATTFDVIKNNTYEGGVIAPGIDISHDALVKYASKLNKISIIRTKSLVGNNTKDSMQSGFYWGYISLINGLIDKIIKQQGFKPTIILTGGLANIFKKEISQKTEYEPNLTLNGLYLIGKIKYE